MAEDVDKKADKSDLRDEKGRFLPGVLQPGAGRPPGTFSIRALIARKLKENPEEAKQFVEMIYRRALKDNDSKEFKYVETVIESIDGKLTQPIGGDPNMPIVLVSQIPGMQGESKRSEDNHTEDADS